MIVFARVLRLLSMVVWVGGLIFFAFVMAPIAFQVLPSTHLAGSVVGATLGVLNKLGQTCGVAFIVAAIVLWPRVSWRQRRLLRAEAVLIMLMIAATSYVRAYIVPAMERDRIAAGGDVDAAPAANPARLEFERLHPLSEKIEGAALFLGVGVVVLMGFEDARTQADSRT